LTDPAGSYSHPVANGRTNPESIPFHEILKTIHTANIKKVREHVQQGVVSTGQN